MAVELIAGLGNPGPQYQGHRHNVGFWLVDQLAHRHDVGWRQTAKCRGQLTDLRMSTGRVRLLKPDTFMNRSGQSVVAAASYFGTQPDQILVVHDDLDLPVGRVRLKRGGGHGGHNGLRDIIPQLGSPDFLRLRIGIGHPGSKNAVTGYVLADPPADQRQALEAAIDQALEVVPLLLEGDSQKAMLKLHSPPETSENED